MDIDDIYDKIIAEHQTNIDAQAARISELEAQRTNMDDEISGLDSMLDASSTLLKAASRRIAELEAAAQWHDASEPPEIGRRIHIDFMDKSYSAVIVDETELEIWIPMAHKVRRWCYLPPMPEGDT